MTRRGVHRPVLAAVVCALLGLLFAVPGASADVVRLKIKEGRTVVDPGSNTVLADENATVTSPYHWLLARDVTGTPTDSAADCRPAHGLTLPSDVLKANGGNTSAPAYLNAVAAINTAYANYPENCDWPSIHAVGPGTAPSVVMTGDDSDWSLLQGLTSLAKGKYMVSVWADGYEVSGGWFTVACGPADTGCDPAATTTAIVYAQRNPLPTATLRVDVFEDNLPTNGQYDVGSEVGLNGFRGDRHRSVHGRGAHDRRLREPDLLRLRADPHALGVRAGDAGARLRRAHHLPALQRRRPAGVRLVHDLRRLRAGLAHRVGDRHAEADPGHRRPVPVAVADADRSGNR